MSSKPDQLSGPEAERLAETRRFWDEQAPGFDAEADHGLRDPLALAAWAELLKSWLPSAGLTVLDIGCGTGSLSVVLAGLGHRLTGIDLSPGMIALAREKAARHAVQIDFQVMDAAYPQFASQQFDVIVCRHLLWALPEPGQVLQRWVKLLRPASRLILIEGYWGTGAGLRANELAAMFPAGFGKISVRNLSADPRLWGRNVTDERYALIVDHI